MEGNYSTRQTGRSGAHYFNHDAIAGAQRNDGQYFNSALAESRTDLVAAGVFDSSIDVLINLKSLLQALGSPVIGNINFKMITLLKTENYLK
jgi:hypothetical protein